MTRILHVHRHPGEGTMVDMVAETDVELGADRESGRFHDPKHDDQTLSSAQLIELIFSCDLVITW